MKLFIVDIALELFTVVIALELFTVVIAFISWSEARSSTGRLVTGTARDGGTAAQKTKLSITRSIFELEARNFVW